MRIREAKWHQTIKDLLKEIGEKDGFDVSESKKETHFTTRFALFEGEKPKKHTLTYKPDVVWKKGMTLSQSLRLNIIQKANSGEEKILARNLSSRLDCIMCTELQKFHTSHKQRYIV